MAEVECVDSVLCKSIKREGTYLAAIRLGPAIYFRRKGMHAAAKMNRFA